jgi:hypothetical protein
VAGLALVFVLVAAGKALQLTPATITWTFVAIAPLAVFALLAGLVLAGPYRQRAYAACIAGCGVSALGMWLLWVSWFGSLEQLHGLSEHDRMLLTDHEHRIADLRERVLGRRQAPQTSVENHMEHAEVDRFLIYQAREDPSHRAVDALNMVRLQAQTPLVVQLQQEKVTRAQAQTRILGYGVVGIGFALVGWSIRRRRKVGMAGG